LGPEENSKVKETALNVLGQIGLPEISDSVEVIMKTFEDKDANVKSMACWALS